MPPRIPSLLDPPVAFAHRGARALAPENTVEAFALALRLGATGIETEAWLTADGIPVLHHLGAVGGRLRRRAIGQLDRADLPAGIPTLAELHAACGPDLTVSVDVKDPAAAGPLVEAAWAAGARLDRLHLCGPDAEVVGTWRPLDPSVRLVHATRLRHVRGGLERHVAGLAAAGIEGLNLPGDDWNGGHTTLCHRFGVLAFAWGAQHGRQIEALFDIGCDGVSSDHPDRLADALLARGS